MFVELVNTLSQDLPRSDIQRRGRGPKPGEASDLDLNG